MKLFHPARRRRRRCQRVGAVCLAHLATLAVTLVVLLTVCPSDGWAQILARHAELPDDALRSTEAADPESRMIAPDSTTSGEAVASRDSNAISTRGPDVVDSSSYEWMHIGRLSAPSKDVSEVQRVDDTFARQDVLEILEMQLKFNERPPYVQERYHEFIDARPRTRSRHVRAFRRLARKQFYRHLRRLLKKQWRRDFRKSAWSYDEYMDGVTRINRSGRESGNPNDINVEYFYNTTRNDALIHEDLEGERETVLLRYGPVGLTDEGRLDFDLRSILQPESQEMELDIDPDESENDALSRRVGSAADPVFTGRCVKIRPKLKLRVDPFRAVGGNPERVLRSYGGSIDVSFYSDIVKRKLFTIEAEAKVRREEWGVFVNFVIDGWR